MSILDKRYEGRRIILNTGEEFDVEKVKRTNFVGVDDKGQRYNIPLSRIDKIIGEAKELNIESYDFKKLKKGDFFWINKGGNAVVFKFEEIVNSKIIGINLINNGRVKIDSSFQIGLIK